MEEKHDIVQIKVNGQSSLSAAATTRAFQIKMGNDKTIVVYNHIQSYILEALLKAVMTDDAH